MNHTQHPNAQHLNTQTPEYLNTRTPERLNALLSGAPYLGYSYAYPHKTAYRPLTPPVPLRALWQAENRAALFLYLHVPFCEMRCGFCNLFTTANPQADFTRVYLEALRRQAEQMREALGEAGFARLAIGGGTPTFLDMAGLETLFDIAERLYGVDTRRVPVSVETSPRTAEAEKLRLLRDHSVDRISIGVQSFQPEEVAAVGRAQTPAWVEEALTRIRDAGFPTLNIDLIYGLPGQTPASWLDSLRAALRYAPEELFLYPLYVRPLTGLGRHSKACAEDDELRLACYRLGRDLLLASGYRQISMRMFARQSAPTGTGKPDVAYCCQQDGMVGLGCGARSYTRALHYASEYAVGATGVRSILRDYVSRPAAAFALADYGVALDEEEQRRRYLIQSLLQVSGLDLAAYRARFGGEALEDFPCLCELADHELATVSDGAIVLTAAGMERSDVIGPWLYSPAVRERMDGFQLT
jgi:oxygen-independent coproporphyrinogen-3 oxidase